jgi:hypothetical protein
MLDFSLTEFLGRGDWELPMQAEKLLDNKHRQLFNQKFRHPQLRCAKIDG